MTSIILSIIDDLLSFVEKTRREGEMVQSIPIFRDAMTCSKKILLTCIFSVISSLPGFSQSNESALALYQKGQSLVAKNPEKAYPLFVQAMQVSKQNKDWEVYVNAVNKLAWLALQGKVHQEEVFTWTKEAIKILKEVKKDTALAELHYNVAEFYNLDGEIELPIAHYEFAIKIWISLIGEWNKEIAKCQQGLGDVYKYNKLDFGEAEKSYEKALLIREKIHFKDTLVLYQNYYSLAATNRSQRDFEKALSYGSKAMELAEKLQVARHVEMSTGMVANIYRDMDELTLAKKYYLKALTLNKKTRDLENRAWYYQCLGETMKNDSLYKPALQNFLLAKENYSLAEVYDKILFIHLLMHMSETYVVLQNEKEFLKTIKQVFQELSEMDEMHSRQATQGMLLLGDYYKKTSNDSALFYYQKALGTAVPSFQSLKVKDNPTESMIGFVYYVYEILVKKASALKVKFSKTHNVTDLEQSIDCLVLAEKLLSKERNTLDMEDAKWRFLDTNYDLYEDILSSLFDGVDVIANDTLHALAFRFFEQSKARSLADALTETERTGRINLQDSLLLSHAELKRKLLHVQDRINRELEKSQDSKQMSVLREEIVRLDRSIQHSKQGIEKKYPGYFNVKYGYHTPALQEVQRTFQDRKQVMIEYFWGTDWVYALGISEDKVLFKKIGEPDSIKTLVNALLSHLVDEHSSMNQKSFHVYVSNSYRLYEILVGPFKPLMLDKMRIQIIPDGPISQVPFEILLEENSDNDQVNYRSLKYMIKSHAIGYAYSTSMFVHKKRNVVRRPSLLAVGFTGGQRLRTAEPEQEEIQGAEQELDALSKRFDKGKFLIGNEATEANFKTLSPDFDIIHLAIHGKGDVKKNFSASLYFRSKYDSLDDGELHAYELYGLKLKALMTVLSACESGLGKGYKGEGMISMASAFTYSGCENILMSLWKVNDQASTILMDDFYGQLLEGETIDIALRQAKLNYLETSDELTADPKIWAPLVAYGSLNEVFQKDKSRIIFYTSFGAILILLAIYFINNTKTRR